MEGRRYIRYNAVLLLAGAVCANASQTFLQAQETTSRMATRVEARVTVDVDRVPLAAVLTNVARQAGLRLSYARDILPVNALVTLHVRNVPVADAFSAALQGTRLSAIISRSGMAMLTVLAGETALVRQGTITGIVTDGRTKLPLPGVSILIDDTTRGVVTAADGSFVVHGVTSGLHRVTARLIGYVRQSVSLTVADGQAATVTLALAPSANMLDQVVVTGTIIPTELKAVPNAITVITAKQIEERGITHIDQLFHGDVPGLFAMNDGASPFAPLGQVTTFTRGASKLDDGGDPPTTSIKTYVDGVELTDPSFLNQIDPRSIERIEILTGPQASTIYGSNAINGVMQIFTKRGISNTPQLTLNLLSGVVQNNFSNALTPQHDYSMQVSGNENRVAYHLGSSWNYLGPWTPSRQMTRLDVHGGARLQLGPVSADVSARRGVTLNHARAGESGQPSIAAAGQGVFRASLVTAGGAPDVKTVLRGQTLGLSLTYLPVTWWSHEWSAGIDQADQEIITAASAHTIPDDTLLFYSQLPHQRSSQRYASTIRLPVTENIQATLSMGADHWRTQSSLAAAQGVSLTGSLFSPTVRRDKPDKNTGIFLQGQLGLHRALFATYGLRVEWNPNYGDNAQPNLAPRYGVAFTQNMGSVTAKIRASYGRATRPPLGSMKLPVPLETPALITLFGKINTQLASPDLGPEFQQGGEGGLELYMGTRSSLIITRYNQTVDGIITNVTVDSARSLQQPASGCLIEPDGYCYFPQTMNLNLGSIRNQGWEVQGMAQEGPVMVRGTYSWVKSRMIGIAPQYRAQFANVSAYQPGATFTYVPEHTWALNVAYARAATRVSVDVMGTGFMYRNFRDDLVLNLLFSRLDMHKPRIGAPAGYRGVNPGYTTTDLNVSRAFSSVVEGILQVQNLTNFYRNDYSAQYATLGRQTKGGVRLLW